MRAVFKTDSERGIVTITNTTNFFIVMTMTVFAKKN